MKFFNFLKEEFEIRKSKNSSYSLRAFARDLQVDQSWLAAFFKGERPVTLKIAQRCLDHLNISDERISVLLKEFEINEGEFKTLEEGKLEFLSEWKYWALLELFKIDPIPNYDDLSTRLKISQEAIKDSVETLAELGFIKIRNGEVELLSPNNNWASTSKTSEARMKLQEQLLDLSKVALKHIPIYERIHSSLTVAIDKKRLPELLERLSKLQMEFGLQAQKSGNLEEVYQLTLSFFPLIKTVNSED